MQYKVWWGKYALLRCFVRSCCFIHFTLHSFLPVFLRSYYKINQIVLRVANRAVAEGSLIWLGGIMFRCAGGGRDQVTEELW